ncbi:hypothetical protein AAVH_35870 [Aphelenchoides avenae]|nr:hypothetical protein AAVH_35870 [Aphelenchus avenae]
MDTRHRKMWDLYGHETAKHVRWDDGLNGGDSYYLKIIHSCPCSNVTSGDPCKARPAMLCIDLEDRLKTMSPNEKTLAFDLGEVDLSAPWKYYYCPDYDEGINTPCAP